MPTSPQSSLARRGFLARLTATAAGTAAFFSLPRPLVAAPLPLATTSDPDAWIARLTGRDKLLLHARTKLMPALNGAAGILRDAAEAYGVAERENSLAVAVHGPAISGVFGSALWAKYPFGEIYGFKDSAGAPVKANPFLAPQEGESPEAVVTKLQARGVTFVVCNVAVRNLAKRLAGAGADAAAVGARHEELLAGLVPGVVAVPNVFVAISHAQQRGVGYLFIDG